MDDLTHILTIVFEIFSNYLSEFLFSEVFGRTTFGIGRRHVESGYCMGSFRTFQLLWSRVSIEL